MALRFTFLDYSPSYVSAMFARIQHLPWSMFLQSAAKDHPDNRFDILVADPIATMKNKDGVNTIALKGGKSEQNRIDPFAQLHALQSDLLPNVSTQAPWPFLGGALGFFSYDLGRQVEILPNLAEDDLAMDDMAVGMYDWALIADHVERKIVCIQPQGQDRLAWLQKLEEVEQPQAFQLVTDWQSNMSNAFYAEQFDRVKEYILSGDCYQINLAQRFSARYQGDEWQAYLKLSEKNGAPFSAFLRLEDRVILSLSPERFLQLKDRVIETKPIKGTRPRDADAEQDAQHIQDLVSAEKDRAENLMIVDLLRNDIGRVATPGTVNVPRLFDVESFPAVHHLVSTVTGQLDLAYQATDILKACFPGGSITGAPKVRAMEIIEELEPHRRTVYCGSVGYISRCQTMDTNIAIRTLVCADNAIYAWAGGGLVADSQVAAEYQETLDKLSRILPVLSDQNA